MSDRSTGGQPFWFGGESWCAATDDGTEAETPVGQDCLYCGSAIEDGDCGYLRAYWPPAGGSIAGLPEGVGGFAPVHRECDFRMVMGGVECAKLTLAGTHVVGDGHPTDPPGMSKREAALARWDFFQEHRL